MSVVSRSRAFAIAILLGLSVAGCGYNTIPTLEENAKAKWAEVQAQYQRRADLIPNLVATVQGYAKQEKDVLTQVAEARAKATQIKIDASSLTDPDKIKQFQDAQAQLSGALGTSARGQRSLSRPQVQRQFPGAAVTAGRHGKPHQRGAARLYRGRPRLQPRAAHFPDAAVGQNLLLVGKAAGRIHRQRRGPNRAPSKVLAGHALSAPTRNGEGSRNRSRASFSSSKEAYLAIEEQETA